MKRLIPVFSVMIGAAQVAVADDSVLLGVWSGNDRASEAIYGTMHIGKNEISWGGSNPYNPYCKTTYSLVAHYSDATYPGNTFRLVAGRTFNIYKLKLDPKPCTGHNGYFQFALPSDNESYAEVVTYDTNERQTGWHNFSKGSDQPNVNPK